jgi:hypothetical protein
VDRGTLKANHGYAKVELDPQYLETVTIDEKHPMMIWLTQTSGSPVNFTVCKSMTSFEIQCNPSLDVSFDYRVEAKRKGYEDVRLELMN